MMGMMTVEPKASAMVDSVEKQRSKLVIEMSFAESG